MRRCICVSLLLCSLAAAPAVADSLWSHNGSLVRLRSVGSERHFEYVRPRSGLRSAGVQIGTVLFRGQVAGNHYSGTAYRFSGQCGPIGYAVEGAISENKGLKLTGRVPIRNRKCSVTGHSEDVLVFSAHENATTRTASTTEHTFARAAVRLPFTVIGCRSLKIFAQWVQKFREADAQTRPEVFKQGMQAEDCAALADGPVEIVKAEQSYLCVRPRQKTECYWTLKAVFDPPRNSPS